MQRDIYNEQNLSLGRFKLSDITKSKVVTFNYDEFLGSTYPTQAAGDEGNCSNPWGTLNFRYYFMVFYLRVPSRTHKPHPLILK